MEVKGKGHWESQPFACSYSLYYRHVLFGKQGLPSPCPTSPSKNFRLQCFKWNTNSLVCLELHYSLLLNWFSRVTQNRLSSLFPWIIKLLFFRGSACYTACGILVPWGGVEPGPLHWEHGVLTTRPGNSPIFFFPIRTAYKISIPQTGWTWGHGSESLKSKPLGHQRTPPEQFKNGPEFKINYTCFYIWLEI